MLTETGVWRHSGTEKHYSRLGYDTAKITKTKGDVEEVAVSTFWVHAVQQFVENVGLLRPWRERRQVNPKRL